MSSIRVKEWIATGEMSGNASSLEEILEEAGVALDRAYTHEILGDNLFLGEDGAYYTVTVEAVVSKANPEYVETIREVAEDSCVEGSDLVEGYEKPGGLCPRGEAAYNAIIALLSSRGRLHSGGQRVFYTPDEWRARGEKYGLSSVLIVVYDGGDHAAYFNSDYDCYKCIDEMSDALAKAGLYVEECTSWCAAVYEGY